MKIFYSILFAILLTACKSSPTNDKESAQSSKPNLNALLHLYKEIDIDTFAVYSGVDDYEANSYAFKGTLIDSSYFYLFPQELQDAAFNDPLVYACYKFNMDQNTIGLITRTPSEYVSSSVKLFILDTIKKQFINTYELSESWGDAGDAMSIDSWLYKSNNNINWFYSRADYSAEDTDSSYIDTHPSQSLAVYTFSNGKAQPIKIDSLAIEILKTKLNQKK